jgi:hypothetical protein
MGFDPIIALHRGSLKGVVCLIDARTRAGRSTGRFAGATGHLHPPAPHRRGHRRHRRLSELGPLLVVSGSPASLPAALDARLRSDEVRILARVNRLLDYWKQPPLERLAQLYADADETRLTTFRELDPYGPRDEVRYDGPVIATGGEAPEWLVGEGTIAGRRPSVRAAAELNRQ